MWVILIQAREVEVNILEGDTLVHLYFPSMLLFFSFQASVFILVVFFLFIISSGFFFSFFPDIFRYFILWSFLFV